MDYASVIRMFGYPEILVSQNPENPDFRNFRFPGFRVKMNCAMLNNIVEKCANCSLESKIHDDPRNSSVVHTRLIPVESYHFRIMFVSCSVNFRIECSDFCKSVLPQIRESGYPDSGSPDFWKSGYPEIRISGYLDFRKSGNPDICRNTRGNKPLI